ncbi:MAG: hypothetical protein QOJ46_877 [bacterium]
MAERHDSGGGAERSEVGQVVGEDGATDGHGCRDDDGSSHAAGERSPFVSAQDSGIEDENGHCLVTWSLKPAGIGSAAAASSASASYVVGSYV